MIQFFIVEIFGDDGQYVFDYFGVDGVGVDEGYDHVGEFLGIGVLLYGENERDEGLKYGMVELHNLSISFGQDQRIEAV